MSAGKTKSRDAVQPPEREQPLSVLPPSPASRRGTGSGVTFKCDSLGSRVGPMTHGSAREGGLAAFERGEWTDAFALLTSADQAQAVGPQ